MGQLDVYSLEDISLFTIMVGPMSTYFSEEIEVSIESIVAYVYSTNILTTKKRNKIIGIRRPTGDLVGAIHMSINYLNVTHKKFMVISRPICDRIMWQDPILSQWQGASDRKNLERLDSKYS